MRTMFFFRAAGLGLMALSLAAAQTGKKDDLPEPRTVQPGDATHPPSDALLLFNGRDMTGWVTQQGKTPACQVEKGVMACTSGSGNLYTTARFKDVQLHLEFSVPNMPDQKGQRRGNSGVYLHGRYEIQILDNFENPTYARGYVGALYGQAPPLVNASRPPGEWSTYDIVFHPHQCDANGAVVRNGTVTVFLNGVLVQDHVRIENTEGGCDGGLMLQDHSGFPNAPVTTMRFRNIWYRPLDREPME